jgi:hypothetical protein
VAVFLLASASAARITVVFGVAGGQDPGEIVFDVEPVLGRHPCDMDAEDAYQLAQGAAESPARPVAGVATIKDYDPVAVVDGFEELPARRPYAPQATGQLAVRQLLDVRSEIAAHLDHGRDAVAEDLPRLIGEEPRASVSRLEVPGCRQVLARWPSGVSGCPPAMGP